MKPVLLVIGGPNGAGKTTVTARLRNEHWSDGVEYLNPDDVARDRFGDWNSPAAVLSAAQWTAQRREELLAARGGIAFETVMSTDEKIGFIARAKDAGYFVRLFFIATTDPRINSARIAGRVLAGGHAVPIDKIVTVTPEPSAIWRQRSRSPIASTSTTTRSTTWRRASAPEHRTEAYGRSTGRCPSGSPTLSRRSSGTRTSSTCAAADVRRVHCEFFFSEVPAGRT